MWTDFIVNCWRWETHVRSSVKQHNKTLFPHTQRCHVSPSRTAHCTFTPHHFFFFPFPFLLPSPCWRLGSAPPDFWVLVFSLGIISATYSITDLRDGNCTRQRLPSSCLSCTRTLPLYWTSRFHSLEYILFFSRNAFSPTAEHTSWISVAVGFSTAWIVKNKDGYQRGFK